MYRENDECLIKLKNYFGKNNIKYEFESVNRNGIVLYKVKHELFPKNHRYFIINGNDLQYFGCQFTIKDNLIYKPSSMFKGLELRKSEDSIDGLYLMDAIDREIKECCKILSKINSFDNLSICKKNEICREKDSIDYSKLFRLVNNIKYKGLIEVNNQIYNQILKDCFNRLPLLSLSNLMNISVGLEDIVKSGKLKKKIYRED